MASQRQSQQKGQQDTGKSACKIMVTDPQLHPSNFTAYKVTMHVIPESIFQEEYQVVIYKRFKDFQRLHRQLSELHTKLQRRDKFPELPEAAYFNRFEASVIEERRRAAEAALQFCADRPHLRQQPLFRAFFQSGVRTVGPPLAPPHSTSSLPASSSSAAAAAASAQLSTSLLTTASSSSAAVSAAAAAAASAAAAATSSSSPETSSPSPPLRPSRPQSQQLLSRSTSAASAASGHQLPDVSEFDPFVVASTGDDADAAAAAAAVDIDASLFASSSFAESSSPPLPLQQQQQTPTELEDELLMSRLHSLQLPSADDLVLDERPPLPPAPPPLDESPSPLSSQPPAPPYLAEAAGHVTEAQRHEAAGDFALAFAEYKAGVEVLLGGVQLDGDEVRRAEVKRKTGQYLRRAEAIYDRYLDSASAVSSNSEDHPTL